MLLTLLIILGSVVIGWLISLLIHLKAMAIHVYRVPIQSLEVDLSIDRFEQAPSEAIAEATAREFVETQIGWESDRYTLGEIEMIS